MKTKLFIVGAALSITAIVSAQRKELRNLKSSVEDEEYAQAKTDISTLEGMMGEMDEDDKEEFYYYKAKAYLGKEDDFSGLDTALEALDMASKTNDGDDYGDEVAELKQQAMNKTINSAVEDQNAERYDAAASKLNKLYNLSPKDTIYLYYAASNAVNGQDFDTALEYYNQLKDLGYEGVETKYTALNKESGEVENFGSEAQRDLMVKAGSHEDPKMETTPAKSPEITEKIALIYMQKGEDQKALDAMADAREQNPDNVDLMKNEAELYRKLDMTAEYEAAMDKIIAKDPNNPDLLVNLGISANNAGNPEKAMEYYKKALEIDPSNAIANLNTAVALLAKDKELVDQMNSLGTSAADNKKYEAFKKERMDVYKDAIPYLEKAAESDPDNLEVTRTLFNIHSQLGNTEKAATFKEKLDSLEGASGK
ncbi:tetratricopeptide repeat protein [Flavimarina sp. Hel_I_48]|uniref:tetratricopeptide repeat protein n=1 Tax=Flavimarina sp. Hel_I_48 TaxID=1392488 RepID=UPI0004DF295C|nr:tetratricopeptide repeat protein [Flavimarina sp. Hel_I_48]